VGRHHPSDRKLSLHLLTARAIAELAGLRFALVEDMRQQIKSWHQPAIAAWLFGSAARGDGDRDSDIDLLSVVATSHDTAQWQQQIGALASLVERRTGNHVQIVEHTRESFLALEAAQSPLTKAFRVDGIELVTNCWPAIAKGSP
jgi:predicted nucleotidyltransferase